MILEPGTFKVSDYRKAIPTAVKIAALLRAITEHYNDKGTLPAVAKVEPDNIRFDHRPALEARQYDTTAQDFIPPQNDPAHIDAITDVEHDFRTFGRRPGAEKTVTTRGSDAGIAKSVRHIKDGQERHRAILAAKAGLANNDMSAVADGLASVATNPLPKRNIVSRGFYKGKRRFGR